MTDPQTRPTPIDVSAKLATGSAPGAIALIQLHGDGVVTVLQDLTRRGEWTLGRVHWCRLGEVDDGLAVLLRPDWAQLMPHGGPRVVQLLLETLARGGVQMTSDLPPTRLFPEAQDEIEARAMVVLSRAASPAAVTRLLGQPTRWRQALAPHAPLDAAAILRRSDLLDRLLCPPVVAVLGPPNVGKSTLANHLAGHDAAVVADLPGTTRDWVGTMVMLDDIAVQWLDTPGLREDADYVEAQAIRLAQDAIGRADLRIAMRDSDTTWPTVEPASVRLWVVSKVDDGRVIGDGTSPDQPLAVSVHRGHGLTRLTQAVVRSLGLHELPEDEPWAFDPWLRRQVEEQHWRAIRAACAPPSS